MLVNKKIKFTPDTFGEQGNAFFIMGGFSNAAKKAKWTKEEINLVLNEATSKDYSHLLATIEEHCE